MKVADLIRRVPTAAVLLCALASLITVTAPNVAAQASPKNGSPSHPTTTSTSPLSLTSESQWTLPNSPPWCMTEDDYDYRYFSGSLNGEYKSSYQLCNSSTDYYNGVWWDAGGEGLQSDVYVVGQLSDLAITAPDGTVHHAVLMGQTTSKGTTTYDYAVCYVPYYSTSTDTGGISLLGGNWQITLSGQMSRATWTTRDDMTDVSFQQAHCPPSEQNLGP